MVQLVDEITQSAGIDAETAKKAIGTILVFLQKQAPPEAINQLIERIPGSDEMIASAQAEGGSGGLMGGAGGLMALAGQLQGLGLGMGEMQDVGKTLFARGRELVGEDVMGEIAASVPGLSQFT